MPIAHNTHSNPIIYLLKRRRSASFRKVDFPLFPILLLLCLSPHPTIALHTSLSLRCQVRYRTFYLRKLLFSHFSLQGNHRIHLLSFQVHYLTNIRPWPQTARPTSWQGRRHLTLAVLPTLCTLH